MKIFSFIFQFMFVCFTWNIFEGKIKFQMKKEKLKTAESLWFRGFCFTYKFSVDIKLFHVKHFLVDFSKNRASFHVIFIICLVMFWKLCSYYRCISCLFNAEPKARAAGGRGSLIHLRFHNLHNLFFAPSAGDLDNRHILSGAPEILYKVL